MGKRRMRMPRILIFEKTKHGLGFLHFVAVRKPRTMKNLLTKARHRLSTCKCAEGHKEGNDDDEKKKEAADGCLSCCHSSLCRENNTVSSRKDAVALLKMLTPFI